MLTVSVVWTRLSVPGIVSVIRLSGMVSDPDMEGIVVSEPIVAGIVVSERVAEGIVVSE